MNKLQEEIERLELQTVRSALDEKTLQILCERVSELGDDISDEEAEEVVKKARIRAILYIMRSHSDSDEEWDEGMREAMATVREVLKDDMELNCREYELGHDAYVFEQGLSYDGKKLLVRVMLEDKPRVCRVDAVHPFQAEPEFAYPLCLKMAAENHPRRYGALKYDESDGELRYEYSFPCVHGLHKDDFFAVFAAVLMSARDSYDVVKQYAVGRFRRAEREEIICKAQRLIIELSS